MNRELREIKAVLNEPTKGLYCGNKRRQIKKEMNVDPKEMFIAPTLDGTLECAKNESLFLFPWATFDNQKKYRMFYGLGTIYRVVKGDKSDLIYIKFGVAKTTKTRLVVAINNHARRQTMTLKRGQVAQVYGMCRYFTRDIEINGVKGKGIQLGLYAESILGWYVPTMMDVRKMPTNDDLVEPTDKEKDLQKEFDDLLNDFMTGKDE